MSIKLNNFVNVDIKYEDTNSYTTTRDTAVLILFTTNDFINEDFDLTFSSKDDIKEEWTKENAKTKESFYTQFKIYFESFFENTGHYLRIIGSLEEANKANIETIIKKLDDERIVIASNAGFEVMKQVAISNEKVTGTSQKLILGYCPNLTHFTKKENKYVPLGISKFIIKYGNEDYTEAVPAVPCEPTQASGVALIGVEYYEKSQSAGQTPGYLVDSNGYGYAQVTVEVGTTVVDNYFTFATEAKKGKDAVPFEEDTYCQGIEMSIAGYLTNVDTNRYDSVQDYSFTQEVYDDKELLSNQKTLLKSITIDDNDLAKTLLSINVNFIGDLLNKSRNLGGNDSEGNAVINMFMLICLHQTLTERLTELLVNKIKYNQSGLAQISAVINKELQKYVDNGYLTTNKSWTEDDLYYKNTLVIKKNTPLSLGYRFVILPFSSLTKEEIDNKELPDIYILIADSYGIRHIDVFGRTY